MNNDWIPFNETNPPSTEEPIEITYIDAEVQTGIPERAVAYFENGNWYWPGTDNYVVGKVIAYKNPSLPYQPQKKQITSMEKQRKSDYTRTIPIESMRRFKEDYLKEKELEEKNRHLFSRH